MPLCFFFSAIFRVNQTLSCLAHIRHLAWKFEKNGEWTAKRGTKVVQFRGPDDKAVDDRNPVWRTTMVGHPWPSRRGSAPRAYVRSRHGCYVRAEPVEKSFRVVSVMFSVLHFIVGLRRDRLRDSKRDVVPRIPYGRSRRPARRCKLYAAETSEHASDGGQVGK